MFLGRGVALVDLIPGNFCFKESPLWAMNYCVKELFFSLRNLF